jgi:hypothetical protein
MLAIPRRWLSMLFVFLRHCLAVPERRRVLSLRPRVDTLDERIVPDATLGQMINPNLGVPTQINPSLDAILYTPLRPGDTVPPSLHIHPRLTIIINGKNVVIPAGIGIEEPFADFPLHVHQFLPSVPALPVGTIHVEPLAKFPFTLGDFFLIWGQTFNKHDILGHHTDRFHTITMTVNGVPSDKFGNLVLQADQGVQTNAQGQIISDPPGIVITYGLKPGVTPPQHPHHTHTPHHGHHG